jgi:hypothetical protein
VVQVATAMMDEAVPDGTASGEVTGKVSESMLSLASSRRCPWVALHYVH